MSGHEESPEPPPTRREVVTETLHGTEIPDPYRWLEGDGEAVREWTEAQNDYADTHLDTATREQLRPEMEKLAEVTEYGAVKAENGRYFQTVEAPDDDHARLLVRESPDGDGTVLVDPNAWPANDDEGAPTRSMSWFLPAPDGKHVAYAVTEGGDEHVDVHVATVPDAETVAVLEDRGRVHLGLIGFDAVSPGMLAWDADGEGFYYVATGGADAGAQMETELRHWRFDGSEETLLEHDDQHVWPTVRTDRASGTLAVGFSAVGGGIDWYVEVDGALRPVVADGDAETFVVFHEDTVFLQTDHEAPRKRLLTCSLGRLREGDLAFDECETVLPERAGILQSFAVTTEHVVAQYLEDAHSRLAVYDRDGGHVRDLDLPDYASVSDLRVDDAEAVLYRVESFHRPPTLVRADPATGDRRELARADVDVPEGLVVRQEFVDSTDGAEVPVFVCHRADVERDGDNPAVLHGYGGFRSSRPPSFDRFRLPFLGDGGVYAQVCARGGQEYGEAWHEAGMLAEKQHTFDDFVAAAEHLRAVGYADPDRLAVTGRSNGGLSVGAVVTQRPDLWAAARCTVPLLDMLRFHRFLLGESWTTEYGHPEDPEAFEYIREYSPYHNVERGVDYPPVLFTTAVGDTRVHPAHARKMTARLQAEADGGPFLLRTETDAGHGGGPSTAALVTEQVDEWTFLYDRLGMGE
ncbi:prolyl oligopeptidase family serine peptidase [Halomicrococcus sp. NG-SE-24]|uniref:prolyl oligopeptidase family serine peptidase n=1 Tax=Halomicrococcus sp. NG-SE-24 TaxID=3436928 RepID=UPI003D9623CB